MRYALLGGVALLVLVPWFLLLRQPDYLDSAALRFQKLPLDPVAGETASWAPDGERLAFVQRGVWNQIAILDVNRRKTVTLTEFPQDCAAPFWAPNGKDIYYFSADAGGRALFQTSAASGSASLIFSGLGGEASIGGGAISSDGRALAVWKQEGNGNGAIQSVWISSPAGSPLKKYRPSPFEQLPRLRRVRLAFSPYGANLLLLFAPKQTETQLWLLPWPEGRPRRLLAGQDSIQDASWLDHGRILLATNNRLWVADTASEHLLPFTTGEAQELRASASPGAKRIAELRSSGSTDVLSLPLESGAVSPLNSSSGSDSDPAWSPPDDNLAYASMTGIWLVAADGTRHLLVPAETDIRHAWLAFSPDGKWLAYTRLGTKSAQIWAVPTSGGTPQRMTANELNARAASWSPDGLWLTFRTSRAGMIYIEKAPFGGQQATTTLTTAAERAAPQWSPDGAWIVFLRAEGLWLVSPDKDIKTRRLLVPGGANSMEASGWSRDGRSLYVIVRTARQVELQAIDVASGEIRTVRVLGSESWRSPAGGMAFLSQGADTLAASRQRDTSELWLLESFDLPHGFLRRLWR